MNGKGRAATVSLGKNNVGGLSANSVPWPALRGRVGMARRAGSIDAARPTIKRIGF